MNKLRLTGLLLTRLLGLLLMYVSCMQVGYAQQSGGGNYPTGNGVRVKEVDGSPNVPGTQTLVFPNGSLTRAGQTVTVTIAGGTTINSTNGQVPYRVNSTTFGDSAFASNALNSTYLSATSGASGAGLTLTVAGGGTNEALTIVPKGSGAVTIGTTTGGVYALGGVATGTTFDTSIGFHMGIIETRSTGQFTFSSNSDARAAWDAGLARLSAGVVRVTDGSTGAGQLLIGTSTDTADAQLSVYSQSTTRPGLKLRALSGTAGSQNVLESYNSAGSITFKVQDNGAVLGVSLASPGNLDFGSNGGPTQWRITGGHFVAQSDNVFTIGAAGAARPSYLHLAATTVSGVNSPAQITSDQNNYNPGTAAKYLRLSTDASRSVTGLTFTTAQVTGQEHLIINVGSNNIVLVNESASSTAANRFTNVTGADITLAANEMAMLVYDNTSARWRVAKM